MARRRIILKRIGIVFLSFIAVLACVIVYLAYTTFANFARAEKTGFDLARLKAPPGFHISVFAEEVDGARMMAFSPGGVLLVSESGEGKAVALPDPKRAGKAERTVDVLSGLNEPHGIAFYEEGCTSPKTTSFAAMTGTKPTCGRPIRKRSPIYPAVAGIRRAASCFTGGKCTSRPDRVATCASKKIPGERP